MVSRGKTSKSINSDELRWQAESDASTMATYQEIMNDKARMNRAIKIAKSKAADLSKRANAMQNVAKTKVTSKRKQSMVKESTVKIKALIDFFQAHSLRELLDNVNSYNKYHLNHPILKEDIVKILKEEDTYILIYYK